jgi:hypothetical protein
MKKNTPTEEARYKFEDGYLTITVNSYHNTSEKLRYTIKRISRSNLSDFIKLYQQNLEEFLYHNFAVGSVIASEAGWKTLEEMAKLVPVISANGDRVSLNLEELEDDYDMLTLLFLTEDVTEEGVGLSDGGLRPGLLAKLNHLDQGSLLGKALTVTRERKSEEIAQVNALANEFQNPGLETTTPTI